MNILKDSLKDSIKYILTRVFVLIICGIVFLGIFYFVGKKYEKKYTFVSDLMDLVFIPNAYAYSYSGYTNDHPFSNPTYSQHMYRTQNYYNNFNFTSSWTVPEDKDYVFFRFYKIQFYYSGGTAYVGEIQPQQCNNNYCYQPITLNNGGNSLNGLQDYTINMTWFLLDSEGHGTTCWMTNDFEQGVICPVDESHSYSSLRSEITVSQVMDCDIIFYTNQIYFQDDARFIVSAIDRLRIQQATISNAIVDSNTSSSGSSFTTFINNYSNTIPNNITRIVATPLQTIVNLQGSTCTPLQLTIPFLNQQLVLPCMSEIYQQYFGTFFTVYQVIVSGLVTYWCIIGVLNTVKSLLDANDDKIEVLDL